MENVNYLGDAATGQFKEKKLGGVTYRIQRFILYQRISNQCAIPKKRRNASN